MKYSNFLLFFLVSNTNNGQETNNKKYTIDFLNSFLQRSKWKDTLHDVLDRQNSNFVLEYELIFDVDECVKDHIVDEYNVEQKLRDIMLLINYKYTTVFARILLHLTDICCDCCRQYNEHRSLFPHCVKLLKSSIEISERLIIRFISVIDFLKDLLDIETNPFVLKEFKHFIELISQKKSLNENDNYQYIQDYSKTFYNINHKRSDLYKIYQNYNIRASDIDYCIGPVFYDNLKKRKYNLPETYFEFLGDQLQIYIQDMITDLYDNLGFLYDEKSKTNSYVHDFEVYKFQAKLMSFKKKKKKTILDKCCLK
ncbi:uncharacterized protein LOC126907696 [Daktulosphaira vitifoliae]|uniref:uncharacterized protein LOC126907696 n=1 Tax=Daktulosphaira vitifoliae TaxID=58002 RepID=UPI0021A99CE0|nr:uncharacterized protein LOC126907696 [Daktulosphaira vitifoliae]